MIRLLSLIFFFLLTRQPLAAKDNHAHIITGEGPLGSFTSLSFKHKSFQGIAKSSCRSVYLKKKTRRNRGTKLSSVRVPLKPFSLAITYRNISFFFSNELIVAFSSVTPPRRGPPAVF